ncbi:hypothetical protein FJ251_02240 [bacterium]|nr:hypothetical protein [bacterium]
MRRSLALLMLCSLLPLAALARPALPGGEIALQTAAPSGRIVIQLAEGLRMEAAGPVSRAPGAAAAFAARLAALAPAARLAPRFSAPLAVLDALRATARDPRAAVLPDLARYAQIEGAFAPGDRAAGLALLAAIAADPAVAAAWLEPVAVPAALGFDAFTGAVPGGETGPPIQVGAPTPDFSGLQGYLQAAPLGVGAWDVAGVPGALGASVSVIDIEGAWLWSHEDLPAPIAEIGAQINSLGWRNHGTAVLGEIRGQDNGLGVRGITPLAGVGGSSIGDQSVADAILNAALALAVGDLALIELHAPGPNANGSGQFGYVPMEFWQDNFDAIRTATALGRIVCEAAGNGSQDLDDPVYMGLFDRNQRDSGAIMCGATDGSTLNPAWFTNYGSRVDLHGWGYTVTTCGYGGLQGDPLPETQWYTSSFSGTSSASPIVVGAVAALQGMVESAYGFSLDARLAREVLVATGTPQNNPGVHIGPRPNLPPAWTQVQAAGIARVSGAVTDAVSGLPLAGVPIAVTETGSFGATDASGHYAFVLAAGSYTLQLTDFFHAPLAAGVTLASGEDEVLDLAMVPLPLVELSGRVKDEALAPLAGVRVEAVDTPLLPALSDGAGIWTFTGVPEGVNFPLLLGGLPGHGAAWLGGWNFGGLSGGRELLAYGLLLPDADETFEATAGGFSADGSGLWSWGAPLDGGPPAAFSGSKCWGVGQTGDYGDDVAGTVFSPVYDFAGEDQLLLSFHIWRGTEAGFDGVRVQIQEGGTWYPLAPVTGYTDILLGGLGNAPGWSGTSSGWEPVVFVLTEHLSAATRFRLDFGSDGGVTGDGFWFDDWSLFAGSIVTAAPEGAPAASAQLAAWPNPFNPATTIAWSLPAPGALRLEVLDASGRRVALLHDGPAAAGGGSLRWTGRDSQGRALPSGIYFVRLESGVYAASEKLILIK